VDIPQGLITEWYPNASKVSPGPQLNIPPVHNGRIEWNSVEIEPGEKPVLPHSDGASHYFAARNTDSDALRIGQQQEKLLFYRGIANFGVPLSAQVTSSSVELHNTGADPLALAVLFENRDGKIGYRVLHEFGGSISPETPALTGSLDRLKRELSDALVSQGLYRKEADAMIETWRDSWFEEGMRVFYLVPRTLVDRELPLKIEPAPAKIARVFVGREEILSLYRKDRLRTALTTGNTQTLDQFGRFLAPFMRHLKHIQAPSVGGYLAAKAEKAQTEFYNPSCVK